jgi:hypothetical protein
LKTPILGAIGIIWGGGIIVYALFFTSKSASPSYESGGGAGLLFGVILFGVGLYYFLKKHKR